MLLEADELKYRCNLRTVCHNVEIDGEVFVILRGAANDRQKLCCILDVYLVHQSREIESLVNVSCRDV